MILSLPEAFDANEWYLVGATAVGFAALVPLRRTFTRLEMCAMWLFNIFLAHFADFTLAGEPFDMYDINDSPHYGLFDMLMYLVTYPPPCIAVCGIYARLNPRPWGVVLLIAAASAISAGLEWTAAEAGVYHYKGWRLEWSAAVYLLAFAANLAYFRWVRAAERPSG